MRIAEIRLDIPNMEEKAMKDAYLYLGAHRWVTRESVPARLLEKCDRAWATAEDNPGAIDPDSGRPFGGLFLDVVDEISKHVTPLVGRDALSKDQELRSLANQCALDAMLSPRMTRP
jgi:hypothetical protein